MDTSFHYSTEFTLDKSHYDECYCESMPAKTSPKAYIKAAVFLLFGIALIFTDINRYLVYFFIGLGIIEALQVKYHKAWYLMRQMMSKAAGNQVTLIINDKGIHTRSDYVNHSIEWSNINNISDTEHGFLIAVKNGKSYISKRCLDQEAIAFILTKQAENLKNLPDTGSF
ncbi:YcxB family protein [Shewanella sp.]|uniref:YcxB family protein n=1 Tax=Shewanella sp. TaxID=50422 RepID=UPI00405386EB